MEMRFDTDQQRRQAICDCVDMLAVAKNIVIATTTLNIRPNDGIKAYNVSVMDKAVWDYISRRSGRRTRFVGPGFDSYEVEVFVPYELFDADRQQVTDFQFSDDEKVAKVYARIGQRIYAVWKQWRKETWPEVK